MNIIAQVLNKYFSVEKRIKLLTFVNDLFIIASYQNFYLRSF